MVAAAAVAAIVIGFTHAPAQARTSTKAATVATRSSPFGRILVDGQGRTLYLFEKDPRGRSACAGACASYWPPLLVRGVPVAGLGARRSLLGVLRRSDGTRQVSYAGHPLYRFRPDTKPGLTTGQGSHDFGAGWYVISSAGAKIEDGGAG